MSGEVMQSNVLLYIDGQWTEGAERESAAVLSPATGEDVFRVAFAGRADLDAALEAAERGFQIWRRTPAMERYKLMRKAAELLRARVDPVARSMTTEQGKPLAESRGEVLNGADTIDWFAEEARRTYGRIVPARAEGVHQQVVREPVGPVAAFTPWNFPINQSVRKVSAALAAGCSIIVKGPEETPASCAALIQAFHDAGVPAGVVNLVFGRPAEISEYLIPHPVIRKVSFTGSTEVGKHLAALAGRHMKRVTMELGGHAPAVVFEDADLEKAVKILVMQKFRNAGQVCVSPTRFLVQDSISASFVEKFVAATKSIKVGNGLEDGVQMGPLAKIGRIDAMEALLDDSAAKGARIETGGKRIGNRGYFFEPTVLTGLGLDARIMNEEPFGPLAPISTFGSYASAIEEANRLPFGLAAYVYTSSARTAAAAGGDIEAGMVSINHHGVGIPELPFGGVKESGYGSEGGIEAMDAYLNSKLVTHAFS
jgi:succinate-semialdehyde dehydrogenase/glutarate-semialdehyde dehydrogenase